MSSALPLSSSVRLSTPADKLARPYPPLESFETLRHAEQGYYGAITAVDKEFARLLKAFGHSCSDDLLYKSLSAAGGSKTDAVDSS
jgi:arylsulfatase A-like enzyme